MRESNIERTGDRDAGFSDLMRLPSGGHIRSSDSDATIMCDHCGCAIFYVEATRGTAPKATRYTRHLAVMATEFHRQHGLAADEYVKAFLMRDPKWSNWEHMEVKQVFPKGNSDTVCYTRDEWVAYAEQLAEQHMTWCTRNGRWT